MIQTIWRHDAAVAVASVSLIMILPRGGGTVFKLAGAEVTLLYIHQCDDALFSFVYFLK